jgi:hypothetical protein
MTYRGQDNGILLYHSYGNSALSNSLLQEAAINHTSPMNNSLNMIWVKTVAKN